ncbi:MAG: glycosyltransferase family 2 protein [Verrucomicrobia bacterium]|nr:glycosyltransferase family 2 protein [Verrucomicrobiota bacterium]
MEEPFFSVITPSWNQGTFLRGCVGSVVDQNDPDFEHLIFDNCSTDGTTEIVAEFPHVRFVSEPDRGQAHAVNKGLAAARGEIICWLNSDDEYAPGAFAVLREAFSDPAVQVVFGDVRQISYGGQGEVIARAKFASRLDLIRWWGSEVKLHQPAVFFRRGVVKSVGLLREDLHYALDYEYWWRISESFRFHDIRQVLAIQHRQPDSKTIRDWAKVLEERERIFSPFYGLIDGGRPAALEPERRKCLSRQYLILAWAAQDPACARKNLLNAWRQSPALVLRPANLGLIRRIFS